MAEDLEKAIKRPNWGLTITVWVAFGFTVLGCALAFALAIPQVIHCAAGWGIYDPLQWFSKSTQPGLLGIIVRWGAGSETPQFNCMSLNEFGDFLAGTFAPLAFLWLLIAVFYQRADLAETRRAFDIQLTEAQNQSNALQAELAFSKARGVREQIETMLKVLRHPTAAALGQNHLKHMGNVEYFSLCGGQLSISVKKAAKFAKSGGNMSNSPDGQRSLSNTHRMISRLPDLEALRVSSASDADTAVFFADCKLPELIQGIIAAKEYYEWLETEKKG